MASRVVAALLDGVVSYRTTQFSIFNVEIFMIFEIDEKLKIEISLKWRVCRKGNQFSSKHEW